MIYVVDQNMMRSDELRARADVDPDCLFVIPDAALEEMVKHEKWEETLRGSFRILAPVLERVFFSAGIGELLRYEQRTKRPVGLKQLLPDAITYEVREFVRAVLTESERLGDVRRRVNTSRQKVLVERRGGDDLKTRMLADIDRLKRLNGRELTNEARSGRMSADARLGLLKLRAEAILRQFLGFNLPPPESFQPSRLMTTRFIYATLWYQEHWLYEGGLDDAKPKMLANDDFDMEYVLIASFFDDLLSEDRRAKRCAADLRLLTSPDTENLLIEALEAHSVESGRVAL
jgi:hypothetical protein